MADNIFRVYSPTEVQPVNRVERAGKYREDADSGGGYEPFAYVLAREMTKKKEKASKEDTRAPEEKLRTMEGLNQYDAGANAFIYRLSHTADYIA